jgi:hypothetical protein
MYLKGFVAEVTFYVSQMKNFNEIGQKLVFNKPIWYKNTSTKRSVILRRLEKKFNID